jgi:single-strand DNA-binding protein
MSGYVNRVILIGNVGKDPLVSNTRQGKMMARFPVATSKRWRDDSGERMESTTWHNVVVFHEGIAKEVNRTVRKGSSVYVEGELANRKWTDKDGIERWVTEIIINNGFMHRVHAVDEMNSNIENMPGGGGGGPQAPPPDDQTSYGNSRPAAQRARTGEQDSEIPF